MKMSILCIVMVLLVYSSTLHTAEAWYGRDDSPELYDRDSSPEDQGYGYGGYRDNNGYGRYRYNGYGGNYDIDDVSIELARPQIQSQGQRPCGLARMRNGRKKRMITACAGVCPDVTFTNLYVCKKPDSTNCITMQDANEFMNTGPTKPSDNPYILFASKTFAGIGISYTSTGTDTCKVKDDVQTWTCTWETVQKKWSCSSEGFCTAGIKKDGAVYKPDVSTTSTTPLKCPCDTNIADSTFPVNRLCTDCKTAENAASRMNTLLPILPAFNTPYLLINDRTFGATSIDISYTNINSDSADKCRISNDVQVWSCKKKSATNPWTCAPQGFCTAGIERTSATADYLPKTPKCTCPNSFFDNKHVCASCKDKGGALNHVNRKDSRGNVLLPPTAGNARTVYSGQLTYINDPSSTHLCLVSNPPNDVLSWRCNPNKQNKKQWQDCDNIGYCTEIRSKRPDGHLEYKDNACFKDYDNNIWDGVTCPKLDIITVVADKTGANCMVKCRQDYLTDIAKRCNAFNYKAGDTACELMRCNSA